jgi:hypothetical protein
MASVTVGVEGRRSAVGCQGKVRQSQCLFDRSYVVRVREGTVSTVNVGSRALFYPPFIVTLHEGGPTAIYNRRSRSKRRSVSGSENPKQQLVLEPLLHHPLRPPVSDDSDALHFFC